MGYQSNQKMNKKVNKTLIAVASVLGVFILLLYTTLTKTVLFKGFTYCGAATSDFVLLESSLFTSAWVTGFMVSLMVVRRTIVPHLFISLFILAKFILFDNCQGIVGFFAFESASNMLLLIGLWMGHLSAVKFPLMPVKV